ncbi:exodeoxyribonuclease VII large subunit [Lewinella cohaerens]|uniref:exodeoxyribonuclease VII large subunit n=1 Tax=Lewinella cohaerens TaxID=70995 RepID=UPI00037C1B70|nr:exodeoxyribonuclease VII large subunit [Lewinella cohaerens]
MLRFLLSGDPLYLRLMSTYRLFELNTFIRRFVALNLPAPVWVQAEVAEVDERRGHYYLALMEKTEDGQEIAAQAKAVIWSRTANKWQRTNKLLLKDLLQAGREVHLQVQVSFHERFGLQLQVQDLDANYTLGVMAQQRQRTIDELMAAGLLQANKMLRLAMVPQRLAVISSPAAAGWQDFMAQLRDNPYGYDFEVQLFPAAVQGTQASPEIRRQLRTIERRRDSFDAVVIIRGGGARMDLADFDEKELCFAAAQMTLPIISGIGHETDQSIMDMVAHTALKTPTAAANFLIDRLHYLDQQLAGAKQTIAQQTKQLVQRKAFELASLGEQLKFQQKQLLQKEAWKLEQYAQQLPMMVRRRLHEATAQLEQLQQLHQLLSVEGQLKRGFALLSVGDEIIRTGSQLAQHEEVTLHLKDGTTTLHTTPQTKKK